MKNKLFYVFLFFIYSSLSFSQLLGNIEMVEIQSKALKQNRNLLIYTPALYNDSEISFYDVIYVFDASNRAFFDFVHSAPIFVSNTRKKYIVVGITSFYDENVDYARNNDLLPELTTEFSKNRFGSYSGNADNFLKYINSEVIPYIENNYRIKPKRLAVGHSLSASFILYAMCKQSGIFDGLFAISPNLAYNDEMLAKSIMAYDFNSDHTPDFIYMSHADEGINDWKEWKPAQDKVYDFIENIGETKTKFATKAYPDESHLTCFAPSFLNGYKEYFNYELSQKEQLTSEIYEFALTVKVPRPTDEVYITGNQEALGNWSPDKIKLKIVSEYVREITLNLQSPAEFKLTRGTWETEGLIKSLSGTNNIWVNPAKTKSMSIQIDYWADDRD